MRRQRVCKSVKAKEIEEVEEIEEVKESGARRAGARCSHLSIASNRRIVKKNLLLVRYSFERLAKSFKGGGLQRGWGEKVTIQRPGAKPMFGLGAGDRDFQDSTENSNPSLRNRGMRQRANFTSPVSAAIRHVDYFRFARNSSTIDAKRGIASCNPTFRY